MTKLKQIDMFGYEPPVEKTKYTKKIVTPLYEPKNKKPFPLELCNNSKTFKLLKDIEEADIKEEDKIFLRQAASRHIVFHYEKIADYYAQSSKEVQELMEASAVVIIDFKDAIKHGYAKLSDDIAQQYIDEIDEQEEDDKEFNTNEDE